MNSNDLDHDAQAEAERAERERIAAGSDPRVNRYRLIVRALRQPLPPQLHDDFAARVAAMATQREQGDSFEDWMVVLLLLAMGVGALMFVGPVLANTMHAIVGVTLPKLPQLPWRQAVMSAICIGIVWGIDRGLTLRGWMRVHPGSRQF